MSVPQYPKADFHVTTYGNDSYPQRPEDLLPSGPSGGGGGLPWFRGNSPTYPNPSPVAPYTPPETPPDDWQGPLQTGTGGAGGGLLAGLSAKDIMALIAALTGAIGGSLAGRSQSYTPTTTTTDPNLKAIIDRQAKRMDQASPVYESIMAMANGLLPTQYQRANPYLTGAAGLPTDPTLPPTLPEEPPMVLPDPPVAARWGG